MSKIELYKGDCLEVMDKLIADGVVVDAIITDPPYGITACKWDSVIPFEAMWERLNKLIKPNGAIVLFGSEPFSSALRMSNIKNYKYDWIWDKISVVGFANAKKMPLYNIENIICFYKQLPTYNPQGIKKIDTKHIKNGSTHRIKSPKGESAINGGRFKDSYIQAFTNYPKQILSIPRKKGFHPTQKPIALMEYLIKTYTNENELVLDFTMGSGTTGVACKKLVRDFIGIELDDGNFEIAKKRIEDTLVEKGLFD